VLGEIKEIEMTKNWQQIMVAALWGLLQVGCNDDGHSGSSSTCGGGFAACGGDIAGTWIIDGVCTEGNLAEAMYKESGLPAACSGLYRSATMEASGTVTFDKGVETANVNVITTVKVHVTAACISSQAGGVTVSALSKSVCDSMATSMSSTEGTDAVNRTASCTLTGSACDCSLVIDSGSVEDENNYTTSGNTITNTDSNKSQEFCVADDTLQVREETSTQGIAMRYTAHK
jgi:hypothetical protein